MTRHFKTDIRFWFAFFCLFPILGFASSGALAQVQKPQVADMLPLEKKMCQHEIKLYELGDETEINGKTYICVSVVISGEEKMAWALKPALIRSKPL